MQGVTEAGFHRKHSLGTKIGDDDSYDCDDGCGRS